eukprot:1272630-Pyramimonas_sp.AAC.1
MGRRWVRLCLTSPLLEWINGTGVLSVCGQVEGDGSWSCFGVVKLRVTSVCLALLRRESLKSG